jgi:hypothetical protein
MEEWDSLNEEKRLAIERIHVRCDIRESTSFLQDELGVHLQHVQDHTKPASHAVIDCFEGIRSRRGT